MKSWITHWNQKELEKFDLLYLEKSHQDLNPWKVTLKSDRESKKSLDPKKVRGPNLKESVTLVKIVREFFEGASFFIFGRDQ